MKRKLSLALVGLLLALNFGPAYALTHHRHHTRHHTAVRSPRTAAAADNSVKVWVNTNSGVYHYPGERWYGTTEEGKYMTEKAALAEGDRPTRNGQ